jgi:hypothetical protein
MPYHKIHSAFKRDMSKRGNPVIEGDWARPEFAYLYDNLWRWSEKIDGTNTRLHWDGTDVTLGGRTDNAQIPAHLTDAIRKLGLLDTDLWAEKWPWLGSGSALTEQQFDRASEQRPDVTLYGEGYGPKIQKGGGLYRDDVSFILFDVKVGNWWLEPEAVKEVRRSFRIDAVPFWGLDTPVNVWNYIKSGLLTSEWHDRGVQIEGLVGTPQVPLFSRSGERIVMKLKVKDWEDLERSRQ